MYRDRECGASFQGQGMWYWCTGTENVVLVFRDKEFGSGVLVFMVTVCGASFMDRDCGANLQGQGMICWCAETDDVLLVCMEKECSSGLRT